MAVDLQGAHCFVLTPGIEADVKVFSSLDADGLSRLHVSVITTVR